MDPLRERAGIQCGQAVGDHDGHAHVVSGDDHGHAELAPELPQEQEDPEGW
jgi:hypothetical protein